MNARNLHPFGRKIKTLNRKIDCASHQERGPPGYFPVELRRPSILERTGTSHDSANESQAGR